MLVTHLTAEPRPVIQETPDKAAIGGGRTEDNQNGGAKKQQNWVIFVKVLLLR